MSDKITEPIAPDVVNPAPLGPLSGNWSDDDAPAYEGDFQAADHGPVSVKGMPHPAAEIKAATRLLSAKGQVGTINGAVADPIMLMPADINRKNLTLLVYADTKLTIAVADSKSACYNGITFLTVNGGGVVTVPLQDHTGAVWAYSQAASPVDITAVAVTM